MSKRRWAKRPALSAAVFVVALGLAELLARWTVESDFDSGEARAGAERMVAQLRGELWKPDGVGGDAAPSGTEGDDPEYRLHPYYGFDVGAADSDHALHSRWFRQPAAASRIEVLVLGGSVASGFVKDAGRQLETALEALPDWAGREVRVLSSAVGGFRQPQQLHQLEYLLAIGYRPDLVVEIDGFNEVALGVQNARAGVHPALPSISHWAALASGRVLSERALDAVAVARGEVKRGESLFALADGCGAFHSAILSRYFSSRIAQSLARFGEANQAFANELVGDVSRPYFVGPEFDCSDESAVELSAKLWVESSLAMDAICRLHGIRYVHFLQPTLHDEGSKPATQTERLEGVGPAGWALGAKLGYPKLRERGAELVARGVEFVDSSRAFARVTDDLYYDVCHFAPAGNRMLAADVALALGSRPPPPPRAASATSRKDPADSEAGKQDRQGPRRRKRVRGAKE
jgi:hypothetical protein